MTDNLNYILSIFTVLGQICIVVILIDYFRTKGQGQLSRFVARFGLQFAFLVSLTGVLMSLFYSEFIGYEPCVMCWIQRIFLYPQVILLGLALYKKDYGIRIYSLTLSGLGALIALYHYYGQMFNVNALPCATPTATSVSCAVRFFVEFGYVTIPMMSLTAFLMIFLFVWLAKSQKV